MEDDEDDDPHEEIERLEAQIETLTQQLEALGRDRQDH